MAAVLLAIPGTASAEYRTEPGDVLDISVFGAPDLARRAPVNIDGQISIPLLGAVPVAGLSLAEVRTRIGELLQDQKIVRAPQVSVEVAEYRPFYIKGDVSNAGSYPYRPGLTIRQAVALAGGYGARTAGGTNASLGVADLRSDYTSLWTELIYAQARLDRLRAELDGKPTIIFTATQGHPADPDLVARLTQLETRQFDSLKNDQDKSAEHLKVVVGFADDQLQALELQRKEVEESVKLQGDEVEKVRGLFVKGMVTSTRLSDEQRGLAAVKTQLLANIAQAGEVRRLREEYGRKIVENADDRRLVVMKDIEDTIATIAKTRSRLGAAQQKLIEAKQTLSQPTQGPAEAPDIRVFRKVDDKRTQFAGTEDTELAPGDVVEVKLWQDIAPAAPAMAQALPEN